MLNLSNAIITTKRDELDNFISMLSSKGMKIKSYNLNKIDKTHAGAITVIFNIIDIMFTIYERDDQYVIMTPTSSAKILKGYNETKVQLNMTYGDEGKVIWKIITLDTDVDNNYILLSEFNAEQIADTLKKACDYLK